MKLGLELQEFKEAMMGISSGSEGLDTMNLHNDYLWFFPNIYGMIIYDFLPTRIKMNQLSPLP